MKVNNIGEEGEPIGAHFVQMDGRTDEGMDEIVEVRMRRGGKGEWRTVVRRKWGKRGSARG